MSESKIKLAKYHHRADGILTKNNDSFMKTAKFQRAYNAAVLASGEDYGVPWRVHQALWAVESTLHLPGDLVELVTGRGFLMSAVLAGLSHWPVEDKKLWLLDTFLPYKPDPVTGLQNTDGEVSRYYAKSYTDTKSSFQGIDNIEVVEGRIPEILFELPIEKIAFLHVDLNHVVAEVQALSFLWSHVQSGAIVLLDDYANGAPQGRHAQQYAAMNEFADEHGLSILTTPTGQGVILKP